MFFIYVLLFVLSSALFLSLAWILFYWCCSLVVNTKKEYTDNNKFYRAILNFATLTAMFVLRIKVKVSGKEKLDKTQKYLFVSNHRSNLDPILSWYIFKEHNISFISKPENFKVFIFGKIIHRCSFIPINRSDPFKAIESINKASKLLKTGNFSIGVYPEGTRNPTDKMLPFHNGIFRIAQKANAPIAVVAIKNADDVNKCFPLRKTIVEIEVLKTIPAEEVKGKQTNAIGNEVREILESAL